MGISEKESLFCPKFIKVTGILVIDGTFTIKMTGIS